MAKKNPYLNQLLLAQQDLLAQLDKERQFEAEIDGELKYLENRIQNCSRDLKYALARLDNLHKHPGVVSIKAYKEILLSMRYNKGLLEISKKDFAEYSRHKETCSASIVCTKNKISRIDREIQSLGKVIYSDAFGNTA